MANKRGGCKTREKVETLLQHIHNDASSNVVASIEQNAWGNYHIIVKLKIKKLEITIHTLAEWRSYWACWQDIIDSEEAA